MKSFVIILLAFFISHVLVAQQQQVVGNVYYQNSGKQPVSGVEIMAEGAQAGYSKDDGSYLLNFQNINKGASFQIEISEEDGKGKKILLTNKEAIRQFRIPFDPNDRFNLIVADSIELETRKMALAAEILRFKLLELEKLRAELIEKSEQEKQDAEEKKRLFSEIQLLENDLGRMDNELQKKAEYISLINLDDVSIVVQKAVEKIKTASNVDEVLTILDRDRLYQQQRKWQRKIRQAPDSIPKFNAELEAIHDAYELRKELLLSVNRFSDAVLCLEEQIFIRENNLVDSLEMAQHYHDITELLSDIGRYQEAKRYALATKQFVEGNVDLELFNVIADMYLNDIEYDLAEKKDFDAYLVNMVNVMNRMKELILDQKWRTFYDIEFEDKDTNKVNFIFGLAEHFNRLPKGEPTLDKVCDFFKPIYEATMDFDYNEIAALYHDFFCQQTSKLIIESNVQKRLLLIKGTSQKELQLKIDLNRFLRLMYLIEREEEKQLETIAKAIEAREQFSTNDDVEDLVDLYLLFTDDYLYSSLEEDPYLPQALGYFEKALEIQRTQLSPVHFRLADTYYKYANFQYQFEEDELAYALIQKSISIRRSHLSELSFELNEDYKLLGKICRGLERYMDSQKALDKQIKINEIYLAPYNFELYDLYEDQMYNCLDQKEYGKTMEAYVQMKDILNYHIKQKTEGLSDETIKELMDEHNETYVEILTRSGDLKAAKKAWKNYQKNNEPGIFFKTKMNVHIAFLEQDYTKVYDLIKGNQYLDFNERFEAFPESIPLLEEFRKSKVFKALDNFHNPN